MVIAGVGNKIENIDWEKLKTTQGSVEIRKLLASRILLNVQILILYQRCIPSNISVDSVFQGLFLLIDKVARKTTDLEKRGYMSSAAKSKDQLETSFFEKFEFKSKVEFENKIKLCRIKFFGMLFDGSDIMDKPQWLVKCSKTTRPLCVGGEDDMLQDTFNIILKKILPEFIFEMGKQDGINDTVIPGVVDIPIPASASDAYVINNAVMKSYPVKKKMNEDRFGFLNLTGEQSRLSQFCPVTSIADSQPLCSIGGIKLNSETHKRALNYSMTMMLEAPIKVGTYSYIVELNKVNESTPDDYNFNISAIFTGPGFSIQIGDDQEPFNLNSGPLSAVNTFYEILKNISTLTKQYFSPGQKKKKFEPRVILRDFFIENAENLMNAAVKKSIGDYGQEFTALCRFGATDKDTYVLKNIGLDGKFKSIPYNDKGNALRIMIANDRPSAYRGIFMLLFSDQKTINTRTIIGYTLDKISEGGTKNSLVAGSNVINKEENRIRFDPNEPDETIEQDTEITIEAQKKGRLKNVLMVKRPSARVAARKPSSKNMLIFMRRFPDIKKWAKDKGIVLKPTNWKKRVAEFVTDRTDLDIDLTGNHRYALLGGRKVKQRSKRKRIKQKKKTRKKKKNKTRKTKGKSKLYRKTKRNTGFYV